MKPFALEWRISTKDDNKLVREFLKENHISKTALTDIKFSGGSILVDGDPVTVRHKLREGQIVTVVFPVEERSKYMISENIPLQIIYEDPYILVVNKPPYMQSIPSKDIATGTLANAILHYYDKIGLSTTVHLVNRLDKDTSGLLLVAKHRHIHHLLSEQQKVGTLKRRYEAIVHGLIEQNNLTINAPIGRKADSIIEREVRNDGQHALTHVQVVRRLKDMTHLSLQLETGRTHQIRVHLSHIGHPIVGDDLYGGLRNDISRQALHCCEVSLIHPIDQKKIVFTTDLPEDMINLITKSDQ